MDPSGPAALRPKPRQTSPVARPQHFAMSFTTGSRSRSPSTNQSETVLPQQDPQPAEVPSPVTPAEAFAACDEAKTLLEEIRAEQAALNLSRIEWMQSMSDRGLEFSSKVEAA